MSNITKIVLLSLSSLCAAYATYRYFFGQKKKFNLPKDAIEMVYSEICDSTRRYFKYFLEAKKKELPAGVTIDAANSQIIKEFRALINKFEESALKSHGLTPELFREGLYEYKNTAVIRDIDISFKVMEHIILDEEVTEFKIPPQLTQTVVLELLSNLTAKSAEFVKLCCTEFEESEKIPVKKAMIPPRADICRPIYSKILEKHINNYIQEELTRLGVKMEEYKNAVKVFILQENFLEEYTSLTYGNDLRLSEELELVVLSDSVIPENLTKEYLLNINEMMMTKLDTIYSDTLNLFLYTINPDKDKSEMYRTLLLHDESFIAFLRNIKEQCRQLKIKQYNNDNITPLQARYAELLYSRQDTSFLTKLREHDVKFVSLIRNKLASEMKK